LITGASAQPLEPGDEEVWHERRTYPGLIDGYRLDVVSVRGTVFRFLANLRRPDGTTSFSTAGEAENESDYQVKVNAIAADVARLGLVDPSRFTAEPVI
jgi:hypothetical protein